MSSEVLSGPLLAETEIEFVTFRVGDAFLGVDIRQVEEINRYIDITRVPHSPEYVCGVINLRGEVVTIVDLRRILNMRPTEITKQSRTVVVRSKGEQIGLLIDSIADVVKTKTSDIDPSPANVGGAEGRLFKGVYKLETELLVILDINAALTVEAGT